MSESILKIVFNGHLLLVISIFTYNELPMTKNHDSDIHQNNNANSQQMNAFSR